MMSSIIPARLEFQCGHTALVSLPRVKGESSAQRTDRVAREKTAAHARSCDFCPPRMEVVDVRDAIEFAAAVALPQTVVIVEAQPAPPPPPVVQLGAPTALPEPPVALPVPPIALPVVAVVPSTDGASSTTKLQARPRRQSARVAHSAQNGRAINYRFLVRFQTETVVKATDIRDALRQAESLGATEVLALTRTG